MEGTQPFWARAFPLHEPRKLLGLVFVVAVAIIWVAASFVVQGIEERGAHPAVLTFVANSLFAVYVPIYYLNLRWRRRRQQRAAAAALAAVHQQQREHEGSALVPAAVLRSDEGDTLPSPLPADGFECAISEGGGGALLGEDSQNGKGGAEPPAMPLRQLFRAALVVAPLWYLAQFTFNSSLSMTSVTSNTILSSTSALFTFLFAVGLLAEAFTLWKLAFILLLIVGTTMVTVADGMYSADSAAAKESVLGDMLCLLSAVVYGAYTVSIRKLLREDEETPMTMFFGFMGLLIFAFMGPLLLILWLAGVGLGAMSWRMFGLMVAKGLLDNVLSDYLWARAILLLGPTVATAGLALQVPLAVLLDGLLRSPAWLSHAGSTVLTLVGGTIVLAGFFGVNAAGEDDEKTRHAAWEERQAALQRGLGFELDNEELGDAFYNAAPQPHHSRALEQALQRQLSGGGEGGGREPLPSSRSPTVTATVNGVYRSSTDEAPFLGGKLP